MNLSSNAIKYNHFHGTVNVHCEELSDDGNIAVFQFVCSDTGLGMSEEFQKHAFDAFAQEGKQSTTTFSGSGLGLSIVKDIVERMGGTIELESEENIGSTFTVPFEIEHLAEMIHRRTATHRIWICQENGCFLLKIMSLIWR